MIPQKWNQNGTNVKILSRKWNHLSKSVFASIFILNGVKAIDWVKGNDRGQFQVSVTSVTPVTSRDRRKCDTLKRGSDRIEIGRKC